MGPLVRLAWNDPNKSQGYRPTVVSSVMNDVEKECVDNASIMNECQKYFSKLLTNRMPSKEYKTFHKTIEKILDKVISIQQTKRRASDCPFSLNEP